MSYTRLVGSYQVGDMTIYRYEDDDEANEAHFRQASMGYTPSHKQPTPCVYLFRMGDVYKIGFTSSPSQRLLTLDTPQLPYETELEHTIFSDQAKQLETELHHKFNHCRLRGEWFALTNDDVAYIKSLGGDV